MSAAGARKVALVVDYQNVHLVGHGLFYGDGKPKHETLLDPGRFADRVLARRAADWREGPPPDDVLVALKFVELAMSTVYDVVILCSHDSDLDPAIEHALHRGHGRVETAGWMGAYVPRGGKRLWHTALDAADFDACRDPRQY